MTTTSSALTAQPGASPRRPLKTREDPTRGVEFRALEEACRAGFTLVEAMIVLAVMAVALVTLLPRIDHWSGQLRVELAASELVGVLRQARSLAVRTNSYVAVKFFPDADRRPSFALYRDGDGDGVRNRDIKSGVDPPIGRPRDLGQLGGWIRLGFPPGLVPSEPGNPGRAMTRLDDPIRFNRSDLASFSPLGLSTPGTLYLTDGFWLYAVRVYNRSGKVQVLRYDRERDLWRGAR